MVDRYGLRVDFLIGVFSQWLMNLIKWAATASPLLTPHQAYYIMMLGQVIGGIGQPLIFNMVRSFDIRRQKSLFGMLFRETVHSAGSTGNETQLTAPPVDEHR